MKVIELEDRTIYRADKGKKVKFANSDTKFSEIVVNKDHKTNINIVEVE